MLIAFAKPGIVDRFLGWIFGVKSKSEPVTVRPAPEAAFSLPMLFMARTPSQPAPAVAVTNAVPIAQTRTWALAGRLRSVAAENVPKALKGRRRKTAPPAGKAIPKKLPRVLKIAKASTGVPATAAWRQNKTPAPRRSSNVVALADSQRRAMARDPAADRLAA